MPVLDDSVHQALNRNPPGQGPSRTVVWKLLSYYVVFIALDAILYMAYSLGWVSPLSDPWAYNATMGFLGASQASPAHAVRITPASSTPTTTRCSPPLHGPAQLQDGAA